MTSQEFAVLLVDDQPDLVSGVRRILRLDGYRVDTAASIAELLDRSNWSDYFAILLDRRLPDGMIDKVLPKLATLAPDASIIVTTAYVDLDGALAAIHSGAEDFLLKPVDPIHLRARIKRLADQRRTQADLVRERAFAQLILDTTRALILVLNPNGQILRINRYFEELCGYRQEELDGQSVIEALLPIQSIAFSEHDLARAFDGHYQQGSVHPVRTKAGTICEIAWWGAPLKDDNGKILQLVYTGRDMTEYHRMQSQLVQSERLSAIGEAMTGLAHESRNALQRSQACLDLLSDQLHNNPDSLELLDSIQRSQNDLHRLYEEVRAFAAPIRIRAEVCDLPKVLRKAWADVATIQNHRDLCLHEPAVCENLLCELDAFAMGQVFRNIFENALQACDDPVHVDIKYTEINYTEIGSQGSPAIAVTIRDNGPGLLPEHAQQVFRSFFTTKQNGTGLGMAIAQRIVQAHGGSLTVNTDCDRGAEFVVTLPRSQE